MLRFNLFNKIATMKVILEDGNEIMNGNKKSKNDIREIKTLKQLERVDLNLESPRLLKACENLGIDPSECKKK